LPLLVSPFAQTLVSFLPSFRSFYLYLCLLHSLAVVLSKVFLHVTKLPLALSWSGSFKGFLFMLHSCPLGLLEIICFVQSYGWLAIHTYYNGILEMLQFQGHSSNSLSNHHEDGTMNHLDGLETEHFRIRFKYIIMCLANHLISKPCDETSSFIEHMVWVSRPPSCVSFCMVFSSFYYTTIVCRYKYEANLCSVILCQVIEGRALDCNQHGSWAVEDAVSVSLPAAPWVSLFPIDSNALCVCSSRPYRISLLVIPNV